MKKFLSAFALSVMAMGAHAAVQVPAGNYEAGKTLANNVCAACHGSDGNSSSPAYPRLAGQNAKYIYKQLTEFKSGYRQNGIMQAQVANLTAQDFANAALYFSRQKGKVTLSDPKYTAMGQKLYLGGDGARAVIPCAGCHGPSGKGNRFAAFPRVGGQHADYIKAQLKAFRAAGRDDLTMDVKRTNDAAKAGEKGMMQIVASRLSDADIELLANYMTGLN